ncbi:uncharacterized protein LOC127901830 [Citrus sinensis]|uniref:uncharacterized protein LOC127901830 n=1 Tax=Citrus sinensis TaxID=2711 RepID=UPI002279BC2D|nr:uncharacterized protein LOC127901830 [Citrus sinensis]
MSKGKEKVIEVDDDELDFLPSLLTNPAFDPGIPLEPIKSSVGTSARRTSPQTTSSSGNSNEEGSSGSENTLSEGRGDDSGEVSPLGASPPEGRSTEGGRALSRDYAIDYMTCTTTFDELADLRLRYSIPGEILLKVPGKKDTSSRPPRGYMLLKRAHGQRGEALVPVEKQPQRRRLVLLPIKYQDQEPITDLPTGGGGNWKKKFFFAGGPWGQVAQVDGQDFRVPPRFVVPGSWGVHFPLQPDQLKRVEAVLANSCPSRELITVYNLLKSRLETFSTSNHEEGPQQGRPFCKAGQHRAASLSLEDFTSCSCQRRETSGAATDPASSSPLVGPRSRLPDSRAEHLVPYLNELSKLVSKKNLEDFDGCTLGELVRAMQYNAFHLSCMATYYKAKVGRYDRKMKEDIQSATTRADVAEKKAGELNVENFKLIEQESLAQAKAITLEEELTKVKEDLQRQKAMYEAQFESLCNSHRAQEHPDLKMDDLAAGVAQHMDEEAAKEDAEGVKPIVIEEENSPPRAVPANVGEASTPADVGSGLAYGFATCLRNFFDA